MYDMIFVFEGSPEKAILFIFRRVLYWLYFVHFINVDDNNDNDNK